MPQQLGKGVTRMLLRTDEVQVAGKGIQARLVARADAIDQLQGEHAVQRILLRIEIHERAEGLVSAIAVEVDAARLDVGNGLLSHCLGVGRLLSGIFGRNRLVAGLADVLLRVAAELLLNLQRVIAQPAASHAHNVGFGDFADGLISVDNVLPVQLMREGVDHGRTASFDGFEVEHLVAHERELLRLQLLTGKLALLELLNLRQTELLGFLPRTEWQTGREPKAEDAEVLEIVAAVGSSGEEQLSAGGEGVDEAGLGIIAEHGRHHLKGDIIGVALCGGLPKVTAGLDDGDGNLQLESLRVPQVAQMGLGCLRDGVVGRGQLTERSLEQVLVESAEVAAEDESHVFGHVILLKETIHLRQPRILQAVCGADDRVGVGRSGKGVLLKFLGSRAKHVVGIHVLLLIYRLQFALKESEHGIAQAVGIELAPLRKVLRREIVVKDRLVERGIGVESGAAIARDEVVEFVGNGIVGGLDGEFVDVALYGQALGVVLSAGQQVVLRGDAVEPGPFGCEVGGANLLCALEEQVLEEVAEAELGGALAAAAGPGVEYNNRRNSLGEVTETAQSRTVTEDKVQGSSYGIFGKAEFGYNVPKYGLTLAINGTFGVGRDYRVDGTIDCTRYSVGVKLRWVMSKTTYTKLGLVKKNNPKKFQQVLNAYDGN